MWEVVTGLQLPSVGLWIGMQFHHWVAVSFVPLIIVQYTSSELRTLAGNSTAEISLEWARAKKYPWGTGFYSRTRHG